MNIQKFFGAVISVVDSVGRMAKAGAISLPDGNACGIV
jgi:hypothetical protein